MHTLLTDLTRRRAAALNTPPLTTTMMMTFLESITRLALRVAHLISQLRAIARNLAVKIGAPMMTVSLLVNHSRKASVAVLDQFVSLVMILLTTLVTRMPVLTAWTAM